MRIANLMQESLLTSHVMRIAQAQAMMAGMAIRKRQIDEIRRENLRLVVEACSRRLGKARGGQVYLSRLLNTPETHLSALKHGKRNLRDLPERIEKRLNLGDGWMDREHDESVVEELSRRLPSLPHQQNKGTRAPRPGYVQLPESKWHEVLDRISELESRLASKSSTRK